MSFFFQPNDKAFFRVCSYYIHSKEIASYLIHFECSRYYFSFTLTIVTVDFQKAFLFKTYVIFFFSNCNFFIFDNLLSYFDYKFVNYRILRSFSLKNL
jgi:hypothetical protein